MVLSYTAETTCLLEHLRASFITHSSPKLCSQLQKDYIQLNYVISSFLFNEGPITSQEFDAIS